MAVFLGAVAPSWLVTFKEFLVLFPLTFSHFPCVLILIITSISGCVSARVRWMEDWVLSSQLVPEG